MDRTSELNANVYDPFAGSGTTFIVAEQMQRTCYGIVLSPLYCDITIDRWEALTGKTAEKLPQKSGEDQASPDCV
jgi:DNA modification methylase